MSIRCGWVNQDPLYIAYHDLEWGVPKHNDNKLFELLVLEGAQAGLSWYTILRKREHYRKAFDGFDPRLVAGYGPEKLEELLHNEGIVRNRLKIASAVRNAKAFLHIQEEFGSFDHYVWRFVLGRPIRNRWKELKDVPPQTAESDLLSKDLKLRGFSFVGSTICYAFMQAAGLVNDHIAACLCSHEKE